MELNCDIDFPCNCSILFLSLVCFIVAPKGILYLGYQQLFSTVTSFIGKVFGTLRIKKIPFGFVTFQHQR